MSRTIFSVMMILGGVLTIAVRRHVSYSLLDAPHQRTVEILQVVIGIVAILFGAGLLLVPG